MANFIRIFSILYLNGVCVWTAELSIEQVVTESLKVHRKEDVWLSKRYVSVLDEKQQGALIDLYESERNGNPMYFGLIQKKAMPLEEILSKVGVRLDEMIKDKFVELTKEGVCRYYSTRFAKILTEAPTMPDHELFNPKNRMEICAAINQFSHSNKAKLRSVILNICMLTIFKFYEEKELTEEQRASLDTIRTLADRSDREREKLSYYFLTENDDKFLLVAWSNLSGRNVEITQDHGETSAAFTHKMTRNQHEPVRSY